METDKNIRSIEEHRKDLLREAEQYRLAQQALAGRPPGARIWRRLISWLGQRLIDVGCFLKRRFGAQALSPIETANQPPCEGTD